MAKNMKRARESRESQTSTTTTKPKRAKKIPRRRVGTGCIAMLPDDVLCLIFETLPARTILVLRSVCRLWRSLTSSTAFVLSHACRARTTSIILSSRFRGQLYQLNRSKLAKRVVLENQALPTELTKTCVKFSILSLVASCDGMLCFGDYHYSPSPSPSPRTNYLVCNLLTKDYIRVEGTAHGSTALKAFYFHLPTGEYRLLQHHIGRRSDSDSFFGYDVFGLGGTSRVWRQIDASCDISWPALARSCEQIALHGNLHWPPLPDHPGIIVFDTVSEKFRNMSISRLHDRPNCYHSLVEMGEGLGYCRTSWEEMEIWYLRDYEKEEWIKQYTIPVDEIRTSMHASSRIGHCFPLSIWNGGKEILLKFSNNYFVLYNFTSKTSRKQKIYKSRENGCTLVPHRETLISPSCLHGKGSKDK